MSEQNEEPKKDEKENLEETGKELNTEKEQDNVPKAEKEAQSEQNPADKLKKELEEASDKYLRLYSEFENYKRRTSKERMELMQTAGKEVLMALLPVLDDFERALKAIKEEDQGNPFHEGIKLVQQKLKSTLESKGLKVIKSVGESFDTDYHEAIANVPAPQPELKGKVIDEVEKGYTLADKVIRFAKVVVGE